MTYPTLADVRRVELTPGQRVSVVGFTDGAGTVVSYGAASWACPDTRIQWPGMRIVRVELDAYPCNGEGTATWEERVMLPDGSPAYRVAR